MRNLKIFTLLLAVGITAFTTLSSADTGRDLDPVWFELIPSGDPGTPEDYRPVNEQPCYGASVNVCGVYVLEDTQNPGYPDLDASPIFVYKPF